MTTMRPTPTIEGFPQRNNQLGRGTTALLDRRRSGRSTCNPLAGASQVPPPQPDALQAEIRPFLRGLRMATASGPGCPPFLS
jgi:hypothetical protein